MRSNFRFKGTTIVSWYKLLFIKRYHLVSDLAVLAAAFGFAYLLRFEFALPAREVSAFLHQLPYVISIQLAAMLLLGIHKFLWRYISLAEINHFAKAAFISAVPLLAFRLLLPDRLALWRIPLSVIVIDTMLGFVGVLSIRLLRREVYVRFQGSASGAHSVRGKKRPILLVGAGFAGQMVANEIRQRRDTDLEVMGFVDDDPRKQYSVIDGVEVMGRTPDLPWLVKELKIDHVVIAIANGSRATFRRILDVCESIPVHVRIIPSLSEILQGKVKVTRIRDVRIEDLLGREPIELGENGFCEFVAQKVVMVTGAGGSIGSELARQVARCNPRMLLLVERAEFALFSVDRELRESSPEVKIVPLLLDVGDQKGMERIFAAYLPHVVLHAAAHKHVPIVESNVPEAIRNNVLATQSLACLAGEWGTEVFLLISTDKAVRPTSVMGASKRVAELIVQDLNDRYATRFVAVRFGNVIGSTGSAIPIFYEQIRKGGPVTITHPDMMRYFMTISEAAQLVLEAARMGCGREIFVLDMGEPVRILDLAKEIITLSGFRPYADIGIVFTGVRPGEKLYEQVELTGESISKTRHPKIYIGKIAGCASAKLVQSVNQLRTLAERGDEQGIRAILREVVPESRLALTKPVAQVLQFESMRSGNAAAASD
jgi:FlaA1/EpsC-like NDP-sugar epimerase